MKILQFIILDEEVREGKQMHTVTGECYTPCGKPIPVIVKGKGCIGLGIVASLLITQNSTEIEFNLTRDISKQSKKAYYDLYRNSVTVSNDPGSDPYENATDAVIPGAIAGKKKNGNRPIHDDDTYDPDSLTGIAGIYDDYYR